MPHSHPLREYDPTKIIISWSGIPLNDGIIDGTFLVVKRNEDLWKLKKGGDGEGARIRTTNHSGQVAVTMRSGSPIHQVLSSLANLDFLTGSVVAPLLMLDFLGATVHAGNRAYIKTIPPDSRSTREEPRTWIFECDDLFMFPGGNKNIQVTQRRVGFSGLTTTL